MPPAVDDCPAIRDAERTGNPGLGAALAFAATAFLLGYGTFQLLTPLILAPQRVAVTDFSPWARRAAEQSDGREVPVALAGILALLTVVYAAARCPAILRYFHSRLVRAISALAVVLVVPVFLTSTEVHILPRAGILLAILSLPVVWGAPWLAGLRPPRWMRVALAAAYGAFATLVLLFSASDPAISDYGYFIGPALKWQQGAPLGSFYMQYNLLGTLVMGAMMRLGLHAGGMQLALALVCLVWIGLYWLAARAYLESRWLRGCFLVALFAVRILWLDHHPATYPQVTPLRVELWLPLVLIARRRGLTSPLTALAFAAVYALDALFGFLLVASYLASVSPELIDAWRRGEGSRFRVAAIAAPLGAAVLFNQLVFGSLLAPSASHYMAVQLGFLPIAPHSLFWIVLLLALTSAVAFARAEVASRRTGMFLLAVLVPHLVYFFGRSHDLYLLYLAGIWLLVTFVALDVARRERPRLAPRLAAVLVAALIVLGSQSEAKRLERTLSRIRYTNWFFQTKADARLEATLADWPHDRDDVILLGSDDAYLNYRLRLKQHGFYSPIFAVLFLDDLATLLADALDRGERVLITGGGLDAESTCRDLNASPALRRSARRFDVLKMRSYSELRLAR